jgi:glycerol-3-phosphate cytidylyltransferase-like family protein
LGDELRVIINNDEQVKRKTGKSEPFQNESCRSKIVNAIKPVDRIIIAIDQDESVCESIRYTTKLIKEKF